MPEKGDSMDTIITNAPGYSSVEYSRLLEQAQAKGVSAAKVDEALIDAIQAGKDFTAAVKDVRSQLPDLAMPRTASSRPQVRSRSIPCFLRPEACSRRAGSSARACSLPRPSVWKPSRSRSAP